MSYLSFLYAIDAAFRIMFWVLMLAVLYAAAHLAGYAPACIASFCAPSIAVTAVEGWPLYMRPSQKKWARLSRWVIECPWNTRPK